MDASMTNNELEKRLMDAEIDKAVTAKSATLRAQVAQLRKALMVAINTVECASLDTDGAELPWYAGAKAALRDSEGIAPDATISQFLSDTTTKSCHCQCWRCSRGGHCVRCDYAEKTA